MANLSELITGRRKTGQSRTGSLSGSLKDKLKEKIDPRQLFNQSGILTALFPILKAYKAKPVQDTIGSKKLTSPTSDYKSQQLSDIEKNTSIFAKNMMAIPSIARDINVARRNISKLVQVTSVAPATKADMYFQKSSEMEKLYESSIKAKESKVQSVPKKAVKKSKFSWLTMLGLIGTAGVSYLIVDFLKNGQDSMIKEIDDKLGGKLSEFKNTFVEFTKSSFEELKAQNEKLMESVENSTNNFLDEIAEVFTLKNISSYVIEGKGPIKTYEVAIENFKSSLVASLSNFSIISSAQAATLPSIVTKPKSMEPTNKSQPLGRETTPTRITPSDGTFNLRSAIGGSESGGRYDLAFGDRLQNGRLVNTIGVKTPEQYSGKKLTDMTLEEVYRFQNYRSSVSQNSGALGKYGFMPQTLFGNDGKGGLVKNIGLNMTTKFSPEIQERLQDQLEKEQRVSRANLNIPETPGFVYMTHYIGPGGTAEIIRAIKNGEGNLTVAQIWNRKFGTPYGIDVGKNNTELTKIRAKDFESILEKRLYRKHQELQRAKGNVVEPEIGKVSMGTNMEMLSRQTTTEESTNKTSIFVVKKTIQAPSQPSSVMVSQFEKSDLEKLWLDIQTT